MQRRDTARLRRRRRAVLDAGACAASSTACPIATQPIKPGQRPEQQPTPIEPPPVEAPPHDVDPDALPLLTPIEEPLQSPDDPVRVAIPHLVGEKVPDFTHELAVSWLLQVIGLWLAGRGFIRNGTDESAYDKDAEPFCNYVAGTTTFAYQDSKGVAATKTLAQQWCGCSSCPSKNGQDDPICITIRSLNVTPRELESNMSLNVSWGLDFLGPRFGEIQFNINNRPSLDQTDLTVSQFYSIRNYTRVFTRCDVGVVARAPGWAPAW